MESSSEFVRELDERSIMLKRDYFLSVFTDFGESEICSFFEDFGLYSFYCTSLNLSWICNFNCSECLFLGVLAPSICYILLVNTVATTASLKLFLGVFDGFLAFSSPLAGVATSK